VISKEFIDSFKAVIVDAGKTFNREPHEVTTSQFWLHSKGKVSPSKVRSIGYAALREYCFPTPKAKLDAKTEDMIKRILNG
jgi:hypothetical protein